MNLLVLGHSVLDHIKEPAGFRFQPGGIFYTAIGLRTLKKETDAFSLCTLYEPEHLPLFAPAFDCFDMSSSRVTKRIPRVHLTILNQSERCERFENLNEPLWLPEGDLNRFDGILINMISGFEIDAARLRELRSRFNGLIYFDVHSLARGVGESMVREFRVIPSFHEWARRIDILQANESEILTVSEYKEETTAAEWLLRLGVRLVLVTKGESGAAMYSLRGGEIFREFLPAVKTNARNKVGCGDVFGAFFFYTYFKLNNQQRALYHAVKAGGKVTECSGVDDLLALKNVEWMYD